VYNGFIVAPETGDYSFWINSDDTADFQVNGKVVTTYYNGHPASYGAINTSPDVVSVVDGYASSSNKNGFVDANQYGFVEPIAPILSDASLTRSAKIDGLKAVQIQNKLRLDAGQKYPITIRLFQNQGQSSLVVYWLRPSQQSSTACVRPEFRPSNGDFGTEIPTKYKCYEEIPASAFYNNTVVAASGVIVRQKQADVSRATARLARLKSAVATMRTKFVESVRTFFKQTSGKLLSDITTLSVNEQHVTLVNQLSPSGGTLQLRALFLSATSVTVDVDSKLNLDFNPTDLYGGDLGRIPAFTMDQRISLMRDFRVFPSPVTEYKSVEYTVSMFIKIDGTCPHWRNIFYHGAGSGGETDRSPGLWIYPNDSFLHFRHQVIGDWNGGCDLTSVRPPLGKWFHFAVVVDSTAPGQCFKLYYNGRYAGGSVDGGRMNSYAGFMPEWKQNANEAKRLYFGYYTWRYNSDFSQWGAFQTQKFNWYNVALKADEILDDYNAGGVKDT